jgi:hypothetical protein
MAPTAAKDTQISSSTQAKHPLFTTHATGAQQTEIVIDQDAT